MSSSNADDIARRLRADAEQAPMRAFNLTRMYGQILHRRVRANASGRPGPRAQTGDYRRSIALQVSLDRNGAVATVGTNRPQANRLEYGFSGTDSLGRRYDQPPLPHFGPALRQTAEEFRTALASDAGLEQRSGRGA